MASRRRSTSLAVAIALVTATFIGSPSRASSSDDRVPNAYLVSLKKGVSPRRYAAVMAKQYGGRATFTYNNVIQGFAFSGSSADANRLAADKRVALVEQDRVFRFADAIPTGYKHLQRDKVYEAYAHIPSYTGLGVKIAIIDTGVDAGHPVFASHNNIDVADGHSCVGGGTNDQDGHGTATASNAVGKIGVAHEATVVPVRVFPGSSETTTMAHIICGMDYVDGNYSTIGIKIVSMSIAGPGSTALKNAVTRLKNDGLVVIAAAGNNGGATQAPAKFAGVIAASALGSKHRMASFSSSGGDMTAPGVSIHSADKNGGYSIRSGTSRSAPQVAGAAAIILAEDPSATPGIVLDDLQSSGTCPNDSVNGSPGFCGGRWKGDDPNAEPAVNAYCAGILADPASTDVPVCGF